LTKISAVIPAYNEGENIQNVIAETKPFVDEIIVIDDCSQDNTNEIATQAGAQVLSNTKNLGYFKSLKRGLKVAQGDILVTLDADGEHIPKYIPDLINPIQQGKAELVLGIRQKIPRPSERFLNWLTNFRVKTKDSGTGFRALKKDLAKKLDLKGKCSCGVLVLESSYHGGRITELPITTHAIDKKRKIAWFHIWQILYILNWVLFKKKDNKDRVTE
jgi:glycosyltransferase involved in cell wall biosynthesis